MTANAGTVAQAKGSWIVPAVNCTVPNIASVAFTGIDGWPAAATSQSSKWGQARPAVKTLPTISPGTNSTL